MANKQEAIQFESGNTDNNDMFANPRDLAPVEKKSLFKSSAKKKIQLTFKDIVIKSLPVVKRISKKVVSEGRTIIDGVSGTMVPGQFVAIMGGSGKLHQYS